MCEPVAHVLWWLWRLPLCLFWRDYGPRVCIEKLKQNFPNIRAMRQASISSCKKIHVTVLIEVFPCCMEVDTGYSMTIVSWNTLKRSVPKISKRQLDFHHIHLQDYQGTAFLLSELAPLEYLSGTSQAHCNCS
ncbi:hypothetical protein E2320_008090 [Naja naja]|nr:hypothetical protein E2320_008090 [Naja naja]